MDLLVLLFFFGVSSNIVLLLLLKFGFRKNIGDFLTFVMSYGTGPFFLSLIFYASICFFPANENIFYSLMLGAFCLLALILCKNEISELKNIHFDIASKFIDTIKKQSSIVMLLALFFISVYSIQLLVFPIVDNDSVLYLNQSEALFEYKNIDWQKKDRVIINRDDFYQYNSSINSGIPSFNAATYLFQGRSERTFFAFKFLIFYYYILLLLFFMFVIGKISKKIEFPEKKSLTYGLIFFVFSWGISRMLIFSTKEVIIYFFALFSIYIASLLIDEKTDGKKRFQLLTIFAILLGINSFVNLHGIVIEVIVIFVLFILSKNKFIDRIKETGYIFLLSLPFSGFEFLTYFNFIFLTPIQNLLNKFALNNANILVADDALSKITANTASVHQNLYQFHNIGDEYLKGKFQILTNIGYFGVYFWLYIVMCVGSYKKILKESILSFLFLFILFYFFIVIDPFSLTNHPLSIVLWGSPKYAMLLLFLGMIPTSIFLDKIIQKTIDLMEKYRKNFILGGFLLIIIIAYFREIVIKFGLKMLLATIPVFKDISFYRGTVEILYDTLVFAVLVSVVILVVSAVRKEKKWLSYLVNMLVIFVIIVPFFATNVGKIPLGKTFAYAGKSTQFKLENTLFEGDMFRVYAQAKNILPQGTMLAVNYRELYAYDDYFALRESVDSLDINYLISSNCEQENWEILASSNRVCLCGRR